MEVELAQLSEENPHSEALQNNSTRKITEDKSLNKNKKRHSSLLKSTEKRCQ